MPSPFLNSWDSKKIPLWIKLFWVFVVFCAIIIFFLVFSGKRNVYERDLVRVAGLEAVKGALFQYYLENGHYPSSASDWNLERADYGADTLSGSRDYDNLSSLISNFLPNLPKDPLNYLNSPDKDDFYLYRYVASADGHSFVIIYETENQDDKSPQALKSW